MAFLAVPLGCVGGSRWVASQDPRPEDAEAVLGPQGGLSVALQLLPDEVPEIPAREALRPCCAFGSEIRAQFFGIPIPGYRIPNLVGVDDLGPHGYDSGTLPGESAGKPSLELDPERNGLVYTCRGGFIDTAHVRDYLDWGAYLAAATASAILAGEERVIALPDEGARRRVIVRPPDRATVARIGPGRLANELSAWANWNMSIWHEIATWYGWNAVPGFSERASAFSPEDLYSNGLGVLLLEVLLVRNAWESEHTFNRIATRWIDASLRMLGAVPREIGREAANAVDGLWWDSTRRVPDVALVKRRNFEIETPFAPWRVPAGRAPESLRRACGDADPFLLAGDEVHPDIRYDDWITLEIEPEQSIATQEPFPQLGPVITQVDLPRIVEAIRAQNLVEFGPGSDRPD